MLKEENGLKTSRKTSQGIFLLLKMYFFLDFYMKHRFGGRKKESPAFNQIGKGKNHLKLSQIKAFSQTRSRASQQSFEIEFLGKRKGVNFKFREL